MTTWVIEAEVQNGKIDEGDEVIKSGRELNGSSNDEHYHVEARCTL
jgi:hypothetical protein